MSLWDRRSKASDSGCKERSKANELAMNDKSDFFFFSSKSSDFRTIKVIARVDQGGGKRREEGSLTRVRLERARRLFRIRRPHLSTSIPSIMSDFFNNLEQPYQLAVTAAVGLAILIIVFVQLQPSTLHSSSITLQPPDRRLISHVQVIRS